jgi:hypothetical protein
MDQSLNSVFDAVMPAVAQDGLFNSLCTIKQRTNTVTALGQPNMQNYQPIVNLQNIACRFAPQSPGAPPQGDTTRTQQQFDTRTLYHVLLDGYYPEILQQNLANINGTDYEIMSVEGDSNFEMTRLAVRIYTL